MPYKGAAPALQGLAGGEVDFAILPYQSSFDSMQGMGRLKVLTEFSRALPAPLKHIPLISLSRQVPDFEYTISGGYFVRQGTPAERVAALRKAIGEALAKPDVRARLEAEGRTVEAAHRQPCPGRPVLRPVHGPRHAIAAQRRAQGGRLACGPIGRPRRGNRHGCRDAGAG